MGLFANTPDFKLHAPGISKSYVFKGDLEPIIEQIVETRIIDFVSEEQYNDLVTKYEADSLGAEETKLLEYLKPAIAQFTYLHLLTINRVNVTSFGVSESSAEDGTANPASFHAIQDVKEEVSDMGYSFFNKALKYLEAQKATFSLWAGSDSYTQLRNTFVWNLELLNEHATYSFNLHSFLSLKPFLKRAGKSIEAVLSKTLKDDLLSKLKAGTLAGNEIEAVELIQAWEAPLALMLAMPYFRIKAVANNILLKTALDGPGPSGSVDNSIVTHLMTTVDSLQQEAKGALIRFMDTNYEDFPAYTKTENEFSDGETNSHFPNNTNKQSFRV